MPNLPQLATLYACGAFLTAGYYLRQVKGQWRKGVIVGAGWPAYWMLVHGISGTATVILNSLFFIADLIVRRSSALLFTHEEWWATVYYIGAVLTPGVIIYRQWATCSEGLSCSIVVGKAVGWGLVWPSYLIASAF